MTLEEIKLWIFEAEKQKASLKELNFIIFQMDNGLSDKEVEFVRLWIELNAKLPDGLTMPNGEIKQFTWNLLS
jgi:hypothetical protein